MYTVAITTEFETVNFSSKAGDSKSLEPIQYMLINGIKIKVASVISDLSNEKVFTYKEEMNLRKRQTEKYLFNLLAPKAEMIVKLLRLGI